MTITITNAIDAILAGAFDAHLDAITDAVSDRKKAAGRTAFHLVKVGDTGRLKNGRPKYLNGAPFTVTAKRQTKIEIKITDEWLAAHPEATRWRGKVIAPPEMLEFD